MKKIKHLGIYNFKGLKGVSIENIGTLNVFVGKNNSGKSSILHAIDMAGLALNVQAWDSFEQKIEIKDLFTKIGEFAIGITYDDKSVVVVKANEHCIPEFNPRPNDGEKFQSVLITPNYGKGYTTRIQRWPAQVISSIKARNFSAINSLDMLYAMKYYSEHDGEHFTADEYKNLTQEIVHYFPELEKVVSDRTDKDISTLTYTEYGKTLDILYSGTGLKHFIDVLLIISISKANIILIDEPELGLHPDLQRKFIEYLEKLAKEKELQFFFATHSPVFLNYADNMSYYRVMNKKGKREVIPVEKDALHTLISDFGIRPSDIFNQDICLLVEGADDVVFFEHIIRVLYKEEFEKIAISIQQYGGSAAEGIISGSINVSNITTAQKYTFWIRDRDSKPKDHPSSNSTQFRNALEKQGFDCHILKKREIEYYYPREVHIMAQQGNQRKEQETEKIFSGTQEEKYRGEAKKYGICVPAGKCLKRLLGTHFTSKDQLDEEICEIMRLLLGWKSEILGEE
jgi:predicted ATP-dependent endonuclease of OLD family